MIRRHWNRLYRMPELISYAILGSGSSANAYLFSCCGVSIMIDCGFSFKELKNRAERAGADLSTLQAVLLSHTHADHIRGIAPLSRACGIPVYLHHLLDPSIFPGKKPIPVVPVEPDSSYTIGPFTVQVFSLSHDAPHAVNYVISAEGCSFMVATDTGTVTPRIRELMSTADVLFLEANYDEQMLHEGPYPYMLKRRIASELGHLSNTDAIEEIRRFGVQQKPHRIYLCHLSDTNNRPELLQQQIVQQLPPGGRSITVCPKGSLHADVISGVI